MPNLTVTSNATAYHNGSYEATDTGAGHGSATVEGSAVTADINWWGNVSVSGANRTNGITNMGDVETDTLTTTGDADVGGDLSVPVGWHGFDLSYPE